jgi:hypothetical protein
VNQRTEKKEVKINGRTYIIKKTNAREACWLFSTLAAKSTGNLIGSLGNFSRAEFDEIQKVALNQVFILDTRDEQTIEIPSLRNGLGLDDILNADPRAVFDLTTLSIMWNVEPFLDKNESTAQKEQ